MWKLQDTKIRQRGENKFSTWRICPKQSEFAWSAPGRGRLSLPSVTQVLLEPSPQNADWAPWLQREAATPLGLVLPSRAGPNGFLSFLLYPLFPIVPSVPMRLKWSQVAGALKSLLLRVALWSPVSLPSNLDLKHSKHTHYVKIILNCYFPNLEWPLDIFLQPGLESQTRVTCYCP